MAEYSRKGLEAGLRTIGQGSDQRQARRLVSGLTVRPADDGPRVLFLTPRDWALHVQLEGVLATALRQRGASVRFLRCGGGLDICDRANVHEAPPMPCRSCTAYVRHSLDAFDLPHDTLREGWEAEDPGRWDELDDLSLDELAEVTDGTLALGHLMDIPTRWFLLSARLGQDPLGPTTFRAFLTTARRVALGFRAAIDRWRPDTVVMLNGLFAFEAVARAICEEEGIDVVTYERTHRAESFVFARNAAANRYDLSGIWRRRRDTPLTPDEDDALDDYLDGRRRQGHPLLDIWSDAVEERIERPTAGRLVALFTNVTWDSSVLGRDLGFESMHHWLETVVAYFAAHPEHRLVIRAHPAEAKRRGKESREPVLGHLRERFPVLPDNIRVIEPDDPTSSYPIMADADIGLVYTSTVGIEMSVMGKPVILGGVSHYRGLGFTRDATSPLDLHRRLDETLADPSLSDDAVTLARRYAYAFFFDAPLPLPMVDEPIPGLARLTVRDPAELAPGRSEELDRVCDGILGLGSDLQNRYFLARDAV